jgi:raffinose/stachyose/melibiose transport system permease protein
MIPIESTLVPFHFTIRAMPFDGSAITLLIAHEVLSVSIGVFWTRASSLPIPKSLFESASIGGASPFKTFRMIPVPLTEPALIALGLLTFLWTWNDYFLAVILITDPNQLPVTLAIGEFASKYTKKYNSLSAAAVLVTLSVVTQYIFFQYKSIQGVPTGALKG